MTNQIPTVDFETGLDSVVNAIVQGKNKPFVVTIVGLPNSGKSELRLRAKERLSVLGIYGWGGMAYNDLERIAQPKVVTNPQFVFIEDVLFHEGSDQCSREFFGKDPDLRVYMFRRGTNIPREEVESMRLGLYNVVIENSCATERGKYKSGVN
jgi:hypothetical protein